MPLTDRAGTGVTQQQDKPKRLRNISSHTEILSSHHLCPSIKVLNPIMIIKIDWFALVYDIFAYMVAFRSLIDEILYKLNFSRHIDIRRELPADISGHVGIVTGGTRGLGLTVVRALISKGCTVCVASSQTRDKFPQLERKIYADLPEVDPETKVRRGNVMLQYLDLSSMDSVRLFVEEFKRSKLDVNYLICNAGIMFAPRQLTTDNLESHLAINYLGHCLMILDLLPQLKRAADKSKSQSRIICVSSSTHRITKLRFHDILGEENYSSSQAYAQSKLAQIMFTRKLSRFMEEDLGWTNVQAFSLHPGVVLSELYEHVHLIRYFPFLVPLIKLVTRDMTQGAETTLYAALSRELDGRNGDYLEDSAPKEPSKISQDVKDQERLWEITRGLLESWLSSKDLCDNKHYAEIPEAK